MHGKAGRVDAYRAQPTWLGGRGQKRGAGASSALQCCKLAQLGSSAPSLPSLEEESPGLFGALPLGALNLIVYFVCLFKFLNNSRRQT